MGAIGKPIPHVLNVLTEYAKDSHEEVAETCQLALARLEWLETQNSKPKEVLSENPYYSVDPAPPDVKKDVPSLKEKLLDESLSMFERYRAMFGLRNLGSDDAILALCSGKLNSLYFYNSINIEKVFHSFNLLGLQCKSALFR